MARNNAPGFDALPGYEISFERSNALHQIVFNEAVIAASERAVIVHETGHMPTIYFPPEDVGATALLPSDHRSHCEFKGRAAYWSIAANGETAENAVWAYPDPYDEFAELTGWMAFYLDRLTCHWRDGVPQPLIRPGWRSGVSVDSILAEAA